MTRIALTVNGRAVEAEVTPRTHLADFLREQLLLTGTHIGCEHGICGACTVEIDGEIARSCITYAVSCDGASVRTIEGFDDDALMGRLRQAFTQAHALQCGYCTPGMLVAARDLVRRKSGLTRPQIRTEMSGNLCRCTGYVGIISAIESVMHRADSPPPRGEGLGVGGTPNGAASAIPPTLSLPHVVSETRLRRDGGGDDGGKLADFHARSWLGPAPGPAPSAPALPSARPASKPAAAAPAAARRPAATPIAVTVGAIEEIDGATRLTQSFVLPHPRDAVWHLMSDPQAVARCLPGMTLDGPPDNGEVTGRMDVKIGPIMASFAGGGTIEAHPAQYRQVIEGRGGDKRSGSRATGKVDYRLEAVPGNAGGEATRVDVAISYVLTGPLAQIGRSGLVRDLVRRIGEAMAQNIDATLRGETHAQPAALGAASLLLQLAIDRLRALLNTLLRRRT